MSSDNSNKAVLIFVRGLPGSGKSYLTNSLQQRLGDGNTITLDPDATNYESQEYKDFSAKLLDEGVDVKLHPYRYLRAQAHQGILGGKFVIWNQAFTNLPIFKKMIAGLEAYAAEHDVSIRTIVVEVSIDEETAKQRVADRVSAGGHEVSEEAFGRFINDYTSFEGEGFSLVKVSGGGNVDQSVEAVLAQLH